MSSRFPDNRTGNPQDRAQAAEPDRTPQFANPSQPGDEPGTGEAAPPVKGSEKGRGVKPEKGKEKEDRY